MSSDMDMITNRKREIMTEMNVHMKRIIELETELLQLEKTSSRFSEIAISDNMTLSDQQKKIVESKGKNILVVACPGSGKTHTLISRYINLVTKENIDPSSIILITFTKKAGMEMNQRITNILPHKPPYYVGSLHGLGFRLLQQFNKISYTVLDESDSHIMIRQAADIILSQSNDLEDEEKCHIRKQIVYIYDKVSTNYPPNLQETIKNLSISSKYKQIITTILKEYKNIKKEQNLVDFNDLMISFCQLLGTKKINGFIEGIKYIFFDEYQDVNPVQNYILSCFKKSNIMVVGDDAQAIYAFRGSSVRYIWEFEKNFENVTTYYLEMNYRSTPSIVSFFQDIISHNVNQFKKNVKSNMTENGMKPYIMCHNSQSDQYKWVADDIAKKRASGISLRDMVVLSRKNNSLDRLEHELIKHSIPVIKSIGISLLNKQHIKDFIAFLTILTNPKSLIHWKRILALHKNIGTNRANEIIEMGTDVMESISEYNTKNSYLLNFYNFMITIQNKSMKDILYQVQNYLFELWENNGEKNMETRKDDMLSLLMFMNKQSIEEFINNIHLNLEIDNLDDCLFLSTVHGAKGLEWEHVYMIDVDCVNFPSIRQSYYMNEIDNCMEERRLFYVAASRAKKYLSINFAQDLLNDVVISPFIRELNESHYIGSNLTKALIGSYQLKGYISTDVNNYLRFNGYKNLAEMILTLKSTRECIYKYDLPAPITIKNRTIAGNMMDNIIAKIIHCNYPDIVEHFDLPQNNHAKIPEKVYHNYIDRYMDWRQILPEIFYVSTYRITKQEDIDIWKQYLLSDEMKVFYNMVEKSILKLVNNLLNKETNIIRIHTNITCDPIKGEIDIMINDTLIEMKTTPEDACTFPNLCQTLMYGYLLEKKNIKPNNIIILNLWDGTIDNFDMNEFNFYKFKKILYNKNNKI